MILILLPLFFFWFVSIIPLNRSSSGSSRQESPSVPSCKENEKKLHGEKMESSIDEQVQTAVDDSLRSDSVPSLPDEKGNFLCTCMYNYRLGRLPEPFEIFVTELINIIRQGFMSDIKCIQVKLFEGHTPCQ